MNDSMNTANNSRQKQTLLSILGVALLVVAVAGVTYAFFNYTRTYSENSVSVGNISFVTTNSAISVTNVFPIASSEVATDANNVGTGTLTIQGSTNYTNGIDFTVTAQDVSSNIGTAAGKVPISVSVTPSNLSAVTAFGSNSGSMTINSFENGTTISEGATIATGRIPAGTNINGTLTIKAYIDKDAVAITDTYNGTGSTPSDLNGTTSEWVAGRQVLTTAQWNALASTPATFKIKVVANQGSAA